MSNEIYKSSAYIFRCLGADVDRKLVIVCVKRSLLYWVDNSFLNDFEEIDEKFIKRIKCGSSINKRIK